MGEYRPGRLPKKVVEWVGALPVVITEQQRQWLLEAFGEQGLGCTVGDGERLPYRGVSADLVIYDEVLGCSE